MMPRNALALIFGFAMPQSLGSADSKMAIAMMEKLLKDDKK